MEKRGVATCQQCMYWEIAFLCKQINLSFKDMGKHLWHLAFYISSLCVIYILHLHFHGSLVHSLISHHRPPHDFTRDEGLRSLRGSSPFSWLDGTIYLFLSFGIISLTLLSVIIYILVTLSHERDIPCGIADTLWL